MLYQHVSVQPQFISDEESDEDLLSNLEFVEVVEEEQKPEIISARMEVVRKGNKTAIAAIISSKVRILSQEKTLDQFNDYLYDLDIEAINLNMATKP